MSALLWLKKANATGDPLEKRVQVGIILHYRKARAKSQIRRFDEMMSRIDRGTFTGTPLSTNEQVLRAVCKCNIERNVYRDLYRVDPLSPIAFECDATTGTENRLPPTPIIWRTLSSCNSKSFV
ncbi:unnamed protein product [Nippostrongylus brasiliensis]|uniref:Uncharacterized protein n=1 Tax=Nippostrongylus brasiliensis TaxID=27835 RepID=A0A0N4XHB4_NIPBR|nr:unnamed protein product [Nippostrongylus brasiliensis]